MWPVLFSSIGKAHSKRYNQMGNKIQVACFKRYISYRMLSFHRQVFSGDLRTLAGGFSLRHVTCLLLKLCDSSGNLGVDDGTMDFFLRRV
jgi:hypothetical protein